MARVTSRTRHALVGGQPDGRVLTLRVACSICDAAPGSRCQVWRTFKGERLYVKGFRVKFHPERIAAARGEKGAA